MSIALIGAASTVTKRAITAMNHRLSSDTVIIITITAASTSNST